MMCPWVFWNAPINKMYYHYYHCFLWALLWQALGSPLLPLAALQGRSLYSGMHLSQWEPAVWCVQTHPPCTCNQYTHFIKRSNMAICYICRTWLLLAYVSWFHFFWINWCYWNEKWWPFINIMNLYLSFLVQFSVNSFISYYVDSIF